MEFKLNCWNRASLSVKMELINYAKRYAKTASYEGIQWKVMVYIDLL